MTGDIFPVTANKSLSPAEQKQWAFGSRYEITFQQEYACKIWRVNWTMMADEAL